jgi:small subunit ribosomal protein S17
MVEIEEARGSRKIKSGVVVSNKMNKTVVVRVERTYRHPKYQKVVRRFKKYYAHDDAAQSLAIGDTVTIMETRPLSKLKRWRVLRDGV